MGFDNTNTVVLEIDDRDAKAAIDRTNAGLDSVGKKGAAAGREAGDGMTRGFDRSRASLERLTAAAEKQFAGLGKNRIQQLTEQKALALDRVQGDPRYMDRMNAAYEKAIAHERELERSRGLQKVAEDAKKAEQEIRKAGSTLQDAGNRLASVGTTLTFAFTIPFTLGAAAALKMSEQFSRAKTAFTGMMGSVQAAVGFLGELQQFALETPFEFKELIPASQRMKAFGFQTREVIPVLRALGDAAAGLAMGPELIDRIGLALGQMRQKAFLSSQEMRQLADAGIGAWEMVAKKLGKTVAEVTKMTEDRQIKGSVALTAILEGMVQKFAGQMRNQNLLLSGQFSNLKDQAGFALREIGNILTPVASKMVQFGLSTLTAMKEAAQGFMLLPEPIRNTSVVLLALFATIGPLTFGIGQLAKAMGALYGLQAIGGIRMLPQIFRDLSLAATGGTLAMTALETRLLLLGKAALVIGVAFAAWSFGRWIREATGLGDAIDKLYVKLGILSERMDPKEQKRIDEQFGALELKQASQIYESLKKRGILIEKNSMSTQEWLNLLKNTQSQMNVFADMAKRGADAGADGAKKREEAEKHVAQLLRQAHIEEYGGLAKIIVKRQELLEQYGLSAKAIASINELTRVQFANEQKRLAGEFKKQTAEAVSNIDEEQRRRRDFDVQRFKESQEFERETLDIATQTASARFDVEQRYLDQSKDSQVRALEFERTQISDRNRNAAALKVEIEQRKLDIETDYIARSAALQAEAMGRQYDAEVKMLEARRDAGSITEDQFAQRRTVLTEKLTQAASALEQKSVLEIAAMRDDSYIRSAEIYRTAHEQAFESTKRSFESLLDEMFGRAKSWGGALKAILRTAILQPLKEAAATLFASAVTGSRSTGGATSGGLFGGLLGGLLGGGRGFGSPGAPGGTGGFAGPVIPAAMTSFGGLFGGGMLGPGGTGGFAGPVQQSGIGGAVGNVGLLAALKGQGSGLLGVLQSLGNLGTKGGWSGSGLSGIKGIGGTTGGLMMLGGGALGFDGLRRGGIGGLLETTAGGALIGTKFGGPIGALIGGAVGAAAGFIRLFVKGAQEKLHAKIKSVYNGLDVKDSGLLKQIMGTIKSNFGGNIDMGIRSPEIRDLLEMYAMATGSGDKFPVANKMRPLFLSQVGGSLFQTPTYENGRSIGISGGLPFAGAVDRMVASTGASTGPVNVTIQLDGQATTKVMRGEVVQVAADSPALYASANVAGQQSSAGRRESAALAFGIPGLVVG